MKVKLKEYELFLKAIMNHIPNCIARNSKLINPKENQDINKSFRSEQKVRKVSNGYCLNNVYLKHYEK